MTLATEHLANPPTTAQAACALADHSPRLSFDAALIEAMRPAYVAAFRLMRNAESAHDICQEAATRALTARQRFDPDRPFYPWFYRIVRNLCLDRIQRSRTAERAAGELRHAVVPARPRRSSCAAGANEP